jgi:hypothetical protein
MDFFFRTDSTPSPQIPGRLNFLYTEYAFPCWPFGKLAIPPSVRILSNAPLLLTASIFERSVHPTTVNGKAEVSGRLRARKVADEQRFISVISSTALALGAPSCGFDGSFVDSVPRT